MKRLLALIIVLTLLVIGGTIVSADGQTRLSQTRLSTSSTSRTISPTVLTNQL